MQTHLGKTVMSKEIQITVKKLRLDASSVTNEEMLRQQTQEMANQQWTLQSQFVFEREVYSTFAKKKARK